MAWLLLPLGVIVLLGTIVDLLATVAQPDVRAPSGGGGLAIVFASSLVDMRRTGEDYPLHSHVYDRLRAPVTDRSTRTESGVTPIWDG